MKPKATLLALLLTLGPCLLGSRLLAQTTAPNDPPAPGAPQTSTFTVSSTLVLVPALVKTKAGQLVYTLQANDFLLTDDGVPQKLTLEQDTDNQPLALVVLVETGGSGVDHLDNYKDLEPMLDAIVGNVPHKIAVVGFDSTPTLLHGFTPNTSFIARSLDNLDPGDKYNATLDAINYSVNLLAQQPKNYRRAILLFSETIDHGSRAPLGATLRAIGDTNTVIYSIGFASTKADIGHELGGASDPTPGPQHGCFSRAPDPSYGLDENGDPLPPTKSVGAQDLNCIEELVPALRLATVAYIAASNAMRRNISSSVAKLTGGEHFKFKDVKSLQRDLLTISNHIPNRYVLSFHPQNPHPGLHSILLSLPDHKDLIVDARYSYWADDPSAPTTPAKP
jgi:VWFA-related protein